jgi:aminotransferase in exopolysaccharide biosynthesis
MFDKVVSFIRDHYDIPEGPIPLHEPRFVGNDRKYVLEAIDSTFVSSVGKYVDRFEEMIREYTGAKYAVATVNGSAALHMSLILAGVSRDDLVITQPLSFIATCNCISYIGAEPLFVDVDMHTMGLSAAKLEVFLKEKTEIVNGSTYHILTGKRIAACVPMHTFGHPVEIDKIVELCSKYQIALVEDAAESIGSKYNGKHTGMFGLFGTFSLNGNKTITCGGGGVLITKDEKLGKLAKHLTTQAKIPHKWEFVHDHIGYNYRLPNLNAALASAQMEKLDEFISNKRELAHQYKILFEGSEIKFMEEPTNTFSNYWLNAILLKNKEERNKFLAFTNDRKVMTRPAWSLMNKLEMFKNCTCENIDNAIDIENRLVNLPSSVKI